MRFARVSAISLTRRSCKHFWYHWFQFRPTCSWTGLTENHKVRPNNRSEPVAVYIILVTLCYSTFLSSIYNICYMWQKLYKLFVFSVGNNIFSFLNLMYVGSVLIGCVVHFTFLDSGNMTLKTACPRYLVTCSLHFHCKLLHDRQVQPTIVECQKSMIQFDAWLLLLQVIAS